MSAPSFHAVSPRVAFERAWRDPRPLLRRAYAVNAPLTFAGLAMALTLFVALLGLVFDRQLITGVPAWLKPAKFALSFGVYCFSLVYLLTYLRGHRLLVKVATVLIGGGITVEMALIALQAARGTTSHFNTSTTLNATIFRVMGLLIVMVWTMSLVVAVLLLRQRLADSAWAWALRLGLLTTLVGMALAVPMLTTTPLQLAAAHGGKLLYSGAHSVGVADGGPGLPLLGWSTLAGDLRVPHFIGIHGLQAMLVLGWLLGVYGGRFEARQRLALTWIVGLGYLALILLLEWQALRGQSIVKPDGATMLAFLVLLAAVGGSVVLTLRPARQVARVR